MIDQNFIREIPLGIIGSNSFGRYDKISSEETVNMMISDGGLVPMPGYKKVLNIGGIGRGLYASTQYNHLVAVVDNGVYSISADNGLSELFNLSTATGDVFIAENNSRQIGIADGQEISIFNYQSQQRQTVTGVDFLPSYLDFQDDYFISCGVNTSTPNQPIYNQWRLSEVGEGTQWPTDAANVGRLSDKADTCVATVNFNKQLYVMGRKVTDIFVDNDYQLNPYQRNNYMNIDYGCLNPATIATGSIQYGASQQTIPLMCWIGINEKSGPAIMYSTGGHPVQVSTDGINFRIEKLRYPANCYGFMFKLAGHTCYQVVWPLDNLSYLIDFNNERFFTVTDENSNYHIAKRVAFFNNKYYFLSINDGNLYEMASDYYTYDYTDPGSTTKNVKEIPRIRVTPPLRIPNSEPFITSYVDLTIEQGDSLTDKYIDTSISIDGGVSYSNVVRDELNQIAHRQNRFRINDLGMANDLRCQFRFWGFDKFVITNGIAGVY